MLKSLLRFLIFLAVLCGIGYLAMAPLLNWLSYRTMNYTIGRLQSPNLTLSDPSFRSARLNSLKSVTWEDFSINATVGTRDNPPRMLKAKVNAEELTFEATDFFEGLFVATVKNMSVSQEYVSKDSSSNEEKAPDVLQEGNATVPIKLNMTNLADIKTQIGTYAAQIKKLSEEGKTAIPIKFMAEQIIRVKGDTFAVSLWIEKQGESYCLVANREDLKFIAEKILPEDQTFTSADLEIISNNPSRASQLLQMRSDASAMAANAFEQDPSVPEDAYRHVLWSYFLTKEYGPDFAEEVTDAHEIPTDAEKMNNPKIDASHRRDIKNNEIGRKYAALSYSESDVIDHVRTDPKVIRRIPIGN